MIKDCIYYLRKYPSEVGDFSDDQVIKVLKNDRDMVGWLNIFVWLRYLPVMREEADLL